MNLVGINTCIILRNTPIYLPIHGGKNVYIVVGKYRGIESGGVERGNSSNKIHAKNLKNDNDYI